MSTPTFKNLSSLVEQPYSRTREWTRDGGLIETRIYTRSIAKAEASPRSRVASPNPADSSSRKNRFRPVPCSRVSKPFLSPTHSLPARSNLKLTRT